MIGFVKRPHVAGAATLAVKEVRPGLYGIIAGCEHHTSSGAWMACFARARSLPEEVAGVVDLYLRLAAEHDDTCNHAALHRYTAAS